MSRENIGSLVVRQAEFLGTKDIDLFSVDVDGNDFHILAEALHSISPKVICVEYNPKFPPPVSIVMPYDAAFRYQGDDYHGASLQAFCDALAGYKLVCCNLTGANAFFVRTELAGVFPTFDPNQLYQPFRDNLIYVKSEHIPSLKWLRGSLALSSGLK